MNIKLKLFGGFLIMIIISVFMGITFLISSDQVNQQYEFLIEHDLVVLQNAEKLQKLIVDAETGQRGFIIVGEKSFLEPYHTGIDEFKKLIILEKNLVSDNPSQIKKLEKIELLFDTWMHEAAIPELTLAQKVHNTNFDIGEEILDHHETDYEIKNIESSSVSVYDLAILLKQETGKSILDEIRNEFREFILIENQLDDKRFQTVLELESTIKIIMILFITSSIVLGFIIIFLLFKTIIFPIKKLEKFSIEMMKGNLDVEITPQGNDELFTLTKSFNDMKTSIKEKISLEKEISNELREIDIKKEEFTSMVTHELKTPLTPILGWLSVLDKGELLGTLNDKQKIAVNKVLLNSRRLHNLISDLLDAQKLDLGKMSFDVVSVNINSMINNLVENFQPSVNSKKIKIFDSTTETISIKTDRIRLEQVINNLVYNAIDFVPIDTGIIEINAHISDTNLIISIKDNGKGISKEDQDHLFEKFYQVDTSATRKHGGTGLGLSICSGICKGLGGKISVKSVQNKETIFFISLPF